MTVSRTTLLSRILSAEEVSKHMVLGSHGGSRYFLVDQGETISFAERNVDGYFIVESEMNKYGVLLPKSIVWMVERK